MPTTATDSPADRRDTLPPFPIDGSVLTLAPEIIHWTEGWLIQPNGPKAGKPFQFTPRQLRFLAWWYAVDENGFWLFQHGVRRLAKGSGKSPFAAVLTLIEFIGPARVHDIDHQRGVVVGKPVAMPWVQIAASAQDQTTNTMRMVRVFAPKDSSIVEAHQLDPGKTKYFRPPEGTLEVISSSASTAEGAEATFIVGDEREHWKPNNGGIELADVLEDNLAKSGNRMLGTENSWIPGQDSVAERTWEAWVAQEEGRVVSEAGQILYDAVQSRPDLDWQDYAEVEAEMRHIYSDAWWQSIDGVMKRIFSPRSTLSESKRKYGNRPATAEDAWVEPEQWATLAKPDRVVTDNEPVAMFFDGSRSRDATALVGCCMEDGHVFLIGMWEPDPTHTTESVVDVADVDRVVRQTKERYDVVGFFGDVKEWESFVQLDWPNLFGDKLLAWAVPAGKFPQRTAWDMRSRTYDFTKAAELCASEVEEGKFTHDGSSQLARHVANAKRSPNQWGVSVRKESPDSPRKIDGAVCVIGARMVRQQVLGTKAWQRRKRRTGRAAFW